MRKLIFILSILISLSSFGQMGISGGSTGGINSGLSYTVTGDYLKDNFQRSSLGSPYTTSLPNATLTFPSSADLHVTGGNNSFSNVISYSNGGVFFAPDKYKIKLGFVAQTNASTDGIGYGAISTISNNPASFYVKVDLGTANRAGIILYNTTSFAAPLASATGLTFNTGDSLVLEIVRFGYVFYYKLTSVKSSQSISFTYVYNITLASNYEPNLATPSLYFFHGTQDVYLFQVTDLNQKNGNSLGLGDSIMEGYKTSGPGNDWLTVLFSGNTNLMDKQAGVSEESSDAINRVPQVITENPKYVLICLGVNDIYNSVAHTVFKANMDTIVTRLLAAGITPILLAVPPLDAFNVTTNYNPDLQAIATARSVKYVDIFTPLATGTGLNVLYDFGDSLHWNNAGNSIVAQTVKNACPELFTSYASQAIRLNRVPVVPTATRLLTMDSLFNMAQVALNLSTIPIITGGDKAVFYDSLGVLSGNASVFNFDYTNKALNLPSILTTSPGLTVGGLTFTPFAIDNMIMANNMTYNSGYKHTTTGFGEAINFNGGAIYLTAASSGTAGTSATVLTPFYADNTGMVKLGNPSGSTYNLLINPNSITFATSIVPTGGSTDSVLVFTNSAGVSTLKAVAQSSLGGSGGTPAGNSGDVQINSSSAFGTPASDKLFWDITNSRLGIGAGNAPSWTVDVRDAGGAASGVRIHSSGTGTGTYTQLYLDNNNLDVAQHFLTNSTYTPSGIFAASQYSILNTGAGGINFIQDNAAGHIKFVVGGTTLVGEDIAASGAIKLGAYTTGAITGTAVNNLQTDASGNVIQGALSTSATSGSYTPSFTNTTNIASSSLNQASYIQVGNIVHVNIACVISPTVGSGSTVLTFTLPISTATTSQQNIGNGNAGELDPGIVSMASGTTAQFAFQASSTAGLATNFTFMYHTN